jgi:hypothetical protein
MAAGRSVFTYAAGFPERVHRLRRSRGISLLACLIHIHILIVIQPPIEPVMVQQRPAAVHGDVRDLADEHRMVAAWILADHAALDVGHRSRHQRTAELPARQPAGRDAPGVAGLGEPPRPFLLAFGKDAGREHSGMSEHGGRISGVADANEHQRRVEADRREGADREAGAIALGICSGDDSDSRGELAEGVAKRRGADRRLAVRAAWLQASPRPR